MPEENNVAGDGTVAEEKVLAVHGTKPATKARVCATAAQTFSFDGGGRQQRLHRGDCGIDREPLRRAVAQIAGGTSGDQTEGQDGRMPEANRAGAVWDGGRSGKLLQAVQMGARGYPLNEASSAEIIAAVKGVAQGDAICPPKLCKSLFAISPRDFFCTQEEWSRGAARRMT